MRNLAVTLRYTIDWHGELLDGGVLGACLPGKPSASAAGLRLCPPLVAGP